MDERNKEIEDLVGNLISDNNVMIFSATYCPFCTQIKKLFKDLDVNFYALEVDLHEQTQAIKDELFRRTEQRTVPNVFIRGNHIGGCDSTMRSYHDGTLFNFLDGEEMKTYDYDLIVVGGGSGGIAAAKEAALLGKKVALFNFVKPTGHGTVWGLGGTCVNVGCIPKKLMHQASIIGELYGDADTFGWEVEFPGKNSHNWTKMVENVQNYIKKLNFSYVVYFKKNKVDYFNAYAVFKDEHAIESTDKWEKKKLHTARTIILATGGRPHIPDFPGSNLAITSDDLFSLKEKPGKTLVVGASYIALECAGFLHGLGVDVSVVVRSIFLRGFDQQLAGMIGADMEKHGIKFIKGFVPSEIVAGQWPVGDEFLKLNVKLVSTEPGQEEKSEYFDMVLLAVGRNACINGLGLEQLGVKVNEKTKKVIVDEYDRTSCRSIYAIGDVQHGRLELTPVAIKAGKLLVNRLFAKAGTMDYDNVPTTVFTPLEYGCCGLSEEAAGDHYGPSNIEAFHSKYQPLEWAMQNRNPDGCYVKLVCLKNDKMRVVGFHVLGPNAGEITQGFSLAVRMKARKSDFDSLVGIHPTSAEVFTTLGITRSSKPTLGANDSAGC